MRDKITTIGILEKRKWQIEKLAKDKNLSMVTILEYLLSGKIDLKELK